MPKIQEKFDLTGRVAIVTGGVGLLGTEFCLTLAEAGAAVAVVDLNAEKCATVAAELTGAGYQALGVATDITSPESVNAMVAQVVGAFGRLDVLVNSAALDPKFDPDAVSKGIAPGKFEEYPLDQWNAALNVNLTGMFHCLQRGVPLIKANGGGANEGGGGNQAFRHLIANLTVDVGARNPGAIGIDYIANNVGALCDAGLRPGRRGQARGCQQRQQEGEQAEERRALPDSGEERMVDFHPREHHQHQLAELGEKMGNMRVLRDDLQTMGADHDPRGE